MKYDTIHRRPLIAQLIANQRVRVQRKGDDYHYGYDKITAGECSLFVDNKVLIVIASLIMILLVLLNH